MQSNVQSVDIKQLKIYIDENYRDMYDLLSETAMVLITTTIYSLQLDPSKFMFEDRRLNDLYVLSYQKACNNINIVSELLVKMETGDKLAMSIVSDLSLYIDGFIQSSYRSNQLHIIDLSIDHNYNFIYYVKYIHQTNGVSYVFG